MEAAWSDLETLPPYLSLVHSMSRLHLLSSSSLIRDSLHSRFEGIHNVFDVLNLVAPEVNPFPNWTQLLQDLIQPGIIKSFSLLSANLLLDLLCDCKGSTSPVLKFHVYLCDIRSQAFDVGRPLRNLHFGHYAINDLGGRRYYLAERAGSHRISNQKWVIPHILVEIDLPTVKADGIAAEEPPLGG